MDALNVDIVKEGKLVAVILVNVLLVVEIFVVHALIIATLITKAELYSYKVPPVLQPLWT